MNDSREYKYYSAEILAPKNTKTKYVCIPSSWMSFRDFSSQTAVIKHPGEDVLDLDKLVANELPFNAEWPIFKAHVKYGTDVYEDAQDYVKFLEYTEREKPKVLPLVVVAKDAESSNNLKNKIIPSTNQPVTTLMKVKAPGSINKPQLADPNVECNKKSKIELKADTSGRNKVILFTVHETAREFNSNQANEAKVSSNTCIDAESSNILENNIIPSTSKHVTLVKVKSPGSKKKPQLVDANVESNKKPKIELIAGTSGRNKVISYTVHETARESNSEHLHKYCGEDVNEQQQTHITQTIPKVQDKKITKQTILSMRDPHLLEMLKILWINVEKTQQAISKLGELYGQTCTGVRKCLDTLVEYNDLTKNMQDDMDVEELRDKELKTVKHTVREAEQVADSNDQADTNVEQQGTNEQEDNEELLEADYDNLEHINYDELENLYGEGLIDFEDKLHSQLVMQKQVELDNETDEQGEEYEEEDIENEEESQVQSDDEEYCEKQEDLQRNRYPKGRGFPNDFTLPPEYDENDSRWTLKHRKKDNNLVELIPHSNVYIHRMGLDKCNDASDGKDLSRILLSEIFSKSALRTCSVTGKKANAFKYKKLRPGLDKHAVTVLMNFVDQYAYKKSWETLDSHTIMSTLRNKLQDIRARHRKYHKET